MAIDPSRGATYNDLQSLTALKRDARAQDPGALREAARQFESVFTRMLLQSMRQASSGDSLFDSQQSGFYRDMFDDQLSVEMSRGRGLGLADMMVQQLLRSGAGIPAAPNSAAASPATASGAAASPVTAPASSSPPVADVARREAFVRDMLPHAEAAARELGVAPQTLIAHAALETGWGRSMPRNADGASSFNLFGIKAGASWQGPAVGSSTVEFDRGVPGARVEPFRVYDSAGASFGDYVALLKGSSRYAAALGTGTDAAAFAGALQRGGYATDPAYASKLTSVVAGVRAILDAGLKPGDSLPIQPSERPG